ncbi:3-deoxy-D-manno-octulosonic acid transferase [Rhodalgimonas zhirmunskyi]|uniref:3-deoxy-D-manno-octulosonic acid transferase n=1 Tax=Rhodalgimonas zhirmunskyi TaxID=2964767 RepID=A0AAJ1UB50_9RHOB|nr:glycosyltransferase N-terminal domain-containing protein [Rhodoalgimonas zhirmunskyi]MDQ2094428.1 3-deoxy-D-manno-octulosonic acid transferase [Rhodoalgimonas zhirmunskyi]
MAKAPGLALRGWLGLTRAIGPLLPRHLRKRIARGKEDPVRWREKLGHASAERPAGRLVWLHAVGLGEVLALRGLIAKLAMLEPDLHFLVTSGTRGAADAFARNLPPRTIHQFAPLDAPGPARRFLAHWRPDLSIWAEQEVWPGLVYRIDQAGIPLALVNARMNDTSFTKRARIAALWRDILPRFALVSAQDSATAAHLSTLGARDVRTDGSLKSIAPPLADLPHDRAELETEIGTRRVWLAASTHAPDEAAALAAHARLLQDDPQTLLILAPRYPERAEEVLSQIKAAGLSAARRSAKAPITAQTQVYLADALGEMGLFYRLAPVAFVGGSMGAVEGHNPWEPAQLNCAVLHGPRVANFAADYAALDGAGAAACVDDADALYQALTWPDLAEMPGRAQTLIAARQTAMDGLAADLAQMIRGAS